jgi:outer membrane murein-binding lipoprotein Lpp
MMEKLKMILFSVVVLALVGLAGYWSVTTMQSGSDFAANKKIEQLQKENKDLTKQVADLTAKLDVSQAQLDSAIVAAQDSATKANQVASVVAPIKSTTYKNQALIDKLQKLITNKVSLLLKSSGANVGVVQNFLNVYNNTSNKIDNDYGVTTQKAVTAFQKDQGLTANGQADSKTFTQMESWLKKQG